MTFRLLDRLGWYLFLGFGWAALAFLILPTLIVVPMSFGESPFLEFPPTGFTLDWYRTYFSDPTWIQPTVFSFQIALLVAVGSTVIGTVTALALVRGRPRYADALQLFVLSPVIAPNIVVGLAMFFFFAELHMIGNLWAFVVGHSVLAVPYVVLTVSAALQRADPSLELAARGLGAKRLPTFFLITVPSIRSGIISGAIFAFIISFDEPVISFFISGVGDKTLPRRMFEDIEYTVTPTVAAVASLLIGMSVILLLSVLAIQQAGIKRASGSAKGK